MPVPLILVLPLLVLGPCATRTGQTRGHRGSHKRPQRGYYEAAGVAVYLDETRLVPPEPIMEGDGGDLNLGSDRWL